MGECFVCHAAATILYNHAVAPCFNHNNFVCNSVWESLGRMPLLQTPGPEVFHYKIVPQP